MANHRRRIKTMSSAGIEMLNLGISRNAISSTLVQAGREDVRNLVVNYYDAFFDSDNAIRNVRFTRQPEANAVDQELLFNLFAKELFLSGRSIRIVSLSDLLKNETMEDLWYEVKQREGAIQWIFISNFYKNHTNNSNPVLSLQQTEEIETFVKSIHYHSNIGFAFYVGGGELDLLRWWSEDMVHFVLRSSIELQTVAATKE